MAEIQLIDERKTKTFQSFTFIAIFAILYPIVGLRIWLLLLTAFIFIQFITSSTFRWFCRTAPRDFQGLCLVLRLKWILRQRIKADRGVHEIFLEQVEKHPEKEAIIEVETSRKVTFIELNNLANQYAHFFQNSGTKYKEVVAVFLENGIDFVAVWLGLAKIGVISAWINSNLKQQPLLHSIRVCGAQTIVTNSALLPSVLKLKKDGELKDLNIFVIDGSSENDDSDYQLIEEDVKKCPSSLPKADGPSSFMANLCYIYTSGTTGNPKPAIIRHLRYFWMAKGVATSFGILPDDRIYITLPIYHSSAGVLSVGSVLITGCTAVIRKKFSARNFWKDCVKYKCTVTSYIGEICRYLILQDEIPEEHEHSIRLMFGNGLRPEIWSKFVSRFKIAKIGEIYGSTEGNSNLLNIDNTVGACGFYPPYQWVRWFYPVVIMKVDEESGEFVRDEHGLCVHCRPGEIGQMVGQIKKNDPIYSFEGYVSKDETQKKIIRNVLKQGDVMFTSGDLVYWDVYGYIHFRDRIGDTYRWKGENVSTTEVEGIFQFIKSVLDVVVFGVKIPGKEGRAGMAVVVLKDDVKTEVAVEEIARCLRENLSSYAIPVFLRVCGRIDKTATFKLKKNGLCKEGFDLSRCSTDPIFYWDSTSKTYRRFDADIQYKMEHNDVYL